MLLVGDLLEQFLLGPLAFYGEAGTFALEVELTTLLQELAYAHEGGSRILDPGGIDELAHALAAPPVLAQELVEVAQPEAAGFALLEQSAYLVRVVLEEDAVEAHGLGLLAELPQLLVYLEHLVVKAGEHTVERGVGVIDAEHLFHHGLEQHVHAEDHIHEVKVDLPHAPVEAQDVLQVVEHLDVGGAGDVESAQVSVVTLEFVKVLLPDGVVVLDEGLQLLAEHLLAGGYLDGVVDDQHGQVSATAVQAPVPSLARWQLKLLSRPHHAVAAVVDPTPAEHGSPRRHGVCAVEEPGVVLLEVDLLVELERCDVVSPHAFPPESSCRQHLSSARGQHGSHLNARAHPASSGRASPPILARSLYVTSSSFRGSVELPAAVDDDSLASDEAALVGGEEGNQAHHVLRLLRALEAPSVDAVAFCPRHEVEAGLGQGEPGSNGVHADAVRAELLGHDPVSYTHLTLPT